MDSPKFSNPNIVNALICNRTLAQFTKVFPFKYLCRVISAMFSPGNILRYTIIKFQSLFYSADYNTLVLLRSCCPNTFSTKKPYPLDILFTVKIDSRGRDLLLAAIKMFTTSSMSSPLDKEVITARFPGPNPFSICYVYPLNSSEAYYTSLFKLFF